MRRSKTLWAGLCVLVLGSCAELRDREAGVCGNGIIEPDNLEYCDGQAGCVSADAAASCFWSCADQDCPDGFVCGGDDVCRRPGFDFERREPIGTARTVWVELRDLDGDGFDDLISIEAEEGATIGDLVVTYLDPNGQVAQRWEWPAVQSTPEIEDLDEDGLDDLILVVDLDIDNELGSGALVLRNDGQRGFVASPAINSLASLPSPFDFGVRPPAGGGRDIPIVGTHSPQDPKQDPYFVDLVDGAQRTFLGSAHGSKTTLVFNREPPSPSEFVECSRPRVAFGTKDDPDTPTDEALELDVYALCPDSLHPDATGLKHLSSVRSPDPGGFTSRTVWAEFSDYNQDGLIDLMTGIYAQIEECEHCIAVAYGVSDGSFHSDPDDIPSANGDGQFDLYGAHPYNAQFVAAEVRAHGDLNGDGIEDYLFEQQVALSKPGACPKSNSPECGCGPDRVCPGLGGWTRGVFVDVDEGAGPEIVGLRNAGQPTPDSASVDLVRFIDGQLQVETLSAPLGSARDLAAADFDADGDVDVAVTFQNIEGPDQLGVIWGGEFPLEVVPVSTGTDVAAFLGVAPLGSTDYVDSAKPLLALVGLPTEEDETLTGLMAFIADTQNRLIAPIRASTSGAFAVAAGRFEQADQRELLLVRHDHDLERVTVQTADGLFAPTVVTNEGPVYGNPSYFPEISIDVLTGDFDGDGLDDVLRVGDVQQRATYEGMTLFETARVREGEWVTMQAQHAEFITAGGAWPGRNATPARLSDVDGDGSLDAFLVPRLRTPTGQEEWMTLEDRAPVALLNDGTGTLSQPQIASDSDDPIADLELWTEFGSTQAGHAQVFMVVGDEVRTAHFDGATGEIAYAETFTAPLESLWSAAGDLDADGLPDVVIASDAGIIPYYGVSNLDPPDEPEFVGGYIQLEKKPDVVEPPNGGQVGAVVYLNFDGGVYGPGPTDGRTNNWDFFPEETRVPPFGYGPVRDEILALVRQHYSPFNIWVTDIRPEQGSYTTALINPRYPQDAGKAGEASDVGCSINNLWPVYVRRAAAWDEQSPPWQVAGNVAGATGWTLGLLPSSDPRSVTSNGALSPTATFIDECVELANGGGGCKYQECQPNYQNPYQELLLKFGPAQE